MRPSLVLFAALLGGVTAAAPAAPQSPAPFADAITVTATAAPEKVHEVPATVDVVTAGEISDLQANQATDLLRNLPGLDIVQSGSAGKVTSLFSRGTNSAHTLVLWNGIELNDPYLGGFDWSTLSTDGVERIEVVRGPFSALYGSNAVGGVVQLITRRGGPGEGEGIGQLRLEGGSHDFGRAGVSAGRKLGDLAVDLSGHLRRGEGELNNDSYDGEEVDLGLDGALGASAHLGALVRWGQSDLGVPFNYSGDPAPRREQSFDTTSIAVPFSWTLESWQLDAQAARTSTDLSLTDAGNPFDASDADAEREQARLVVRRSFDGASGDEFEVSGGGDWDRQEVTTSDAFGPGLQEENQRTWAAFGQLSWTHGPLRVDAGARRDDNDAFGAETSFKAGAAWAVTSEWRLRASYGEAFRAPSLADLFFPGFSNPDLEPERSKSYEVAIDGGSGPWRTSLALFENDLDNLIEFDFLTFTPQNIGRARARGIEGSLAARFGVFDSRLVATRLDAENLETGGPLLRRADESASLVVFARPGQLTFGGVVRYVGERTDFGDVALDPFTTVDLSVAWRVATRWEPFVRVENVLDEEYEEVAGFPAPGVAFRTGFALRF